MCSGLPYEQLHLLKDSGVQKVDPWLKIQIGEGNFVWHLSSSFVWSLSSSRSRLSFCGWEKMLDNFGLGSLQYLISLNNQVVFYQLSMLQFISVGLVIFRNSNVPSIHTFSPKVGTDRETLARNYTAANI